MNSHVHRFQKLGGLWVSVQVDVSKSLIRFTLASNAASKAELDSDQDACKWIKEVYAKYPTDRRLEFIQVGGSGSVYCIDP